MILLYSYKSKTNYGDKFIPQYGIYVHVHVYYHHGECVPVYDELFVLPALGTESTFISRVKDSANSD